MEKFYLVENSGAFNFITGEIIKCMHITYCSDIYNSFFVFDLSNPKIKKFKTFDDLIEYYKENISYPEFELGLFALPKEQENMIYDIWFQYKELL